MNRDEKIEKAETILRERIVLWEQERAQLATEIIDALEEPKVGDWGWFWNGEIDATYCKHIDELKEIKTGEYPFIALGKSVGWNHFKTISGLAEWLEEREEI